MKNEFTVKNNKAGWLIFGAMALIMFQFFWVVNEYKVIESGKVIMWVAKYFLLPYFILSIFALNIITNAIFYSWPRWLSKENLGTWSKIKNKIVAFIISILLLTTFTYCTIVQTNDWFSSDSHYKYNQAIEDVDIMKHQRGRRSFRKESTSYNVHLHYNNKEVVLNTNVNWMKGDTFDLTVNTGGFWGIQYID